MLVNTNGLTARLKGTVFTTNRSIIRIFDHAVRSTAALTSRINTRPISSVSSIHSSTSLCIISIGSDTVIRLVPILYGKGRAGIFLRATNSVPVSIFLKVTLRCNMLCPVRAFSGRHRISFSRVPYFVRTGSRCTLRRVNSITRRIDDEICRLTDRSHGCLRLSTIFTYGFIGRYCTLDRGVLRRRKVPFSIVLPLVSRATTGIRRLSPGSTRAKPTMECSRGILQTRKTLLGSGPRVGSVCSEVDVDVRGLDIGR